jgi:hypothetical protein
MLKVSPEYMTLEGFFLRDYAQMRERVKELEATIAEMNAKGAERGDRYGVFDLHDPCKAVKVSAARSYNLDKVDEYEGIDLYALKAAYDMGDEDLLEWGTRAYKNKRWYGEDLQPIDVERHVFWYTLRVVETKSERVYVTDGKGDAELIEIDLMEYAMVDNLGKWCREKYEDELMRAALGELRGEIKKAIETLEGQE